MGSDRGKKIGTATGQKIAFHNATPVIQAAHIADPTVNAVTGSDTVSASTVKANDDALKAAIDAILVVLENKGFNATS